MNVSSIQTQNAKPSTVDASHISVEDLAGNQSLTESQKIAEASKQFEAILLRQFLSEAQKTVIKSNFADDDSSTTGIYKDFVTTQMANSLAHAGGIGLAKTFQHQLTPPTGAKTDTNASKISHT